VRTIVDIPEKDRGALDAMARRLGISRAELVRRAIERFLADVSRSRQEAFGIWKDRSEDGVTYQGRLRDEWHRDQ
jgi:metal-responsive CopG/Arc/MetJ family transcriptional regulator